MIEIPVRPETSPCEPEYLSLLTGRLKRGLIVVDPNMSSKILSSIVRSQSCIFDVVRPCSRCREYLRHSEVPGDQAKEHGLARVSCNILPEVWNKHGCMRSQTALTPLLNVSDVIYPEVRCPRRIGDCLKIN